MPTRTEAEEHLRIIRSLMEKATIYRAISAPTALVGGIFACVGAPVLFRTNPTPLASEVDFAIPFLCIWGAVLLLTVLANSFFLWRGSKLRSEPFLSSGMRLALVAMLPGMLCGLFFSAVLACWPNTFWLPPIWMLCYALALLATKHFAPRSIMVLGWAFLVAGMASFSLLFWWDLVEGWEKDTIIHFAGYLNLAGRDLRAIPPGTFALGSNALMALTFGLFHLIYAACTWPRRTSANDTGRTP
jgi:hypothetical protein